MHPVCEACQQRKKMISELPKISLPQTTDCQLCLGLLSTGIINDTAAQVLEQSKKYFQKCFTLHLAFPANLCLREMMFVKNNEIDMQSLFSLKEILKFFISKKLEENGLRLSTDECHLVAEINYSHSKEKEEALMLPDESSSKRPRKKQSTSKNFLKQQTLKRDLTFDYVQPAKLHSVNVKSSPRYLAGRYLKLERHISQTPWMADGKRLTEYSVSELIEANLKTEFDCEVKFMSSGREDSDVLMLGSGRPFLLELIDSKLKGETKDLISLVNSFNPRVQVSCLEFTDYEIARKILKQGEDSKTKTYQCLVWNKEPKDISILNLQDLMIKQKTPIRVSHRRANIVRERKIFSMQARKLTDHYFILELSTQSGTYIKEFVHSDLERTQPSVSSLLGTTLDLLELDVIDIDIEWPPK